MLVLSITHAAISVLLFVGAFTANIALPSTPLCSIDYGHPTYTDCLDLSYSLYNGWPGNAGDTFDHYFSVRNAPIPDWAPPSARSHRVPLRKLAKQGHFSCPTAPGWLTDSPTGNCIVSLTPIRMLDGSITSDTGRWDDIWLASHKAVTDCVHEPLQMGGHIHVGTSKSSHT